MNSDALIAGALARARPAALAGGGRRLGGLPDDVVAERYGVLRALVHERAATDAVVLERLERLEQSEADESWTRWQTSVMLIDADDDPVVIESARGVWEALGSNEYALEFKIRLATYRGFLAGRFWVTLPIAGWFGIAMASSAVEDRYGVPWWVWLPAIVGWPVLVWRLFSASHRARERVGGKELPHV